MDESLPPYAKRLDALHRALADDFRRIIGEVPLSPAAIVLDAGCGDGYFTQLLSERGGEVIGLDNSEAFLKAAESRSSGNNIQYISGDARRLPFPDDSLDIVWSGHSMQSYPDIPRCLREFRRVLKPGGTLAVLETDNVHSIMLSWPPDLELAIRQAEHRQIGDEDSYMGTYFPRFAHRLLVEAGLVPCTMKYVLISRIGPAGQSLCDFVRLYLESLIEKTRDHLSERMRARLSTLADPHDENFLPRQKAFFFGSMQVLMLANAPNGS